MSEMVTGVQRCVECGLEITGTSYWRGPGGLPPLGPRCEWCAAVSPLAPPVSSSEEAPLLSGESLRVAQLEQDARRLDLIERLIQQGDGFISFCAEPWAKEAHMVVGIAKGWGDTLREALDQCAAMGDAALGSAPQGEPK